MKSTGDAEPGHIAHRRGVVLALFVWLALLAFVACSRRQPLRAEASAARVVSLSPPLTETLFYLGASRNVIAVSDYCARPPQVSARPRVGTSMRPDYERIARLSPSLIVTEASMTTDRAALEALAPTELLPWLTPQEVTASVRRLGTLVGRVAPAEQLAAALERTLSVRPPPDAPPVLLVIHGGWELDDVTFIRDNSLHGAVLRAAGARNAVPGPVNSVPHMSLEALIRLDPPAILVLAEPSDAAGQAILEPWQRLTPLRAVRDGRLAVVAGRDVFGTGPSILSLVPRLHDALVRMGVLG
ncbi:MAG: ABC transporter substrate-binding protein [Polyangiaceae bacterium]|nr:ABC transporter substrate-binding protein [Polyangiaceae bacterium]